MELQKLLIVKFLKTKNVVYKIEYGNVCFPVLGSKMAIVPDRSWSDTKRYINSVLAGSYSRNCVICSENSKITVGCCKCSKRTCSDCYINIFKTNRGLSICPFCRYVVGDFIPDRYMKSAIAAIRAKFNIY